MSSAASMRKVIAGSILVLAASQMCDATDKKVVSQRPPRVLLRITPTSSPELGVALTTDDFAPEKYNGRMPIVRISNAEADRIFEFLTDTRFIEKAAKRRETCMADSGLISLYYKRDGILRTRYSGVSLQALGYLERLSDAVSPPAQHEILAAIQRTKDFNYRATHGRDMVPLLVVAEVRSEAAIRPCPAPS